MVDRVTKTTEKLIEGYKNVSSADIVFVGHFPEVPIFPGVLIIEALAQLSGLFLMNLANKNNQLGEVQSLIGILTSVRNFKFIEIVKPGDRLNLKSVLKTQSGNCYNFNSFAYVDNKEVAQGEIQLFTQKKEQVV
jgi:3-hydroxyacyl-[acyl-carrier-protein] dehydratase